MQSIRHLSHGGTPASHVHTELRCYTSQYLVVQLGHDYVMYVVSTGHMYCT